MIFHDTYLDKEQNRRLLVKSFAKRRTQMKIRLFQDVVIEFLTNSSFRLNEIDAEVPDVNIPDKYFPNTFFFFFVIRFRMNHYHLT